MNLELLGFNWKFKESFSVYENQDIIPGRVASSSHGIYKIWTNNGSIVAKVSGRFDYTIVSPMDYPIVGDWVALQKPINQGPGVIHHVLERRSALCRKAAGTVAEVVAFIRH
ncbi:hypothetical protein K8T06_11190 [bacterium]|nr:hypothetical protein [bacterium]